MGTTNFHIITCPVCYSQGAALHHDLRASLVYSCQQCLHTWQIDPAEEPSQADLAVEVVQRTVGESPSAEADDGANKKVGEI